MIILGIETTCDETGVAVVEDGRRILSNVVASSVDLQKKYGGVVPEVAAREQVRVIIPVIKECLSSMADRLSIDDKQSLRSSQAAGLERSTIDSIDAIAVAYGPGLIGSLLIGVETAKTLALVWDKPLIAVNHLIGHIYANWLNGVNSRSLIVNRVKKFANEQLTMNDNPEFPLIALIVSGGHTDLVLMTGHGKYKLLGSTLDDAAGEAFDKVARVLGLGYPGGPEVERLASSVQHLASSIKLPRPMIDSKSFDFSFSGLKTAVVNLVHSAEIMDHRKAEIAYEFQRAVVDVLVTKTINAANKYRVMSIVVGGGVAANSALRSQLSEVSRNLKIPVFFPQKNLAIDNGAMIAAAAFYNFKKVEPLRTSANPGLHF